MKLHHHFPNVDITRCLTLGSISQTNLAYLYVEKTRYVGNLAVCAVSRTADPVQAVEIQIARPLQFVSSVDMISSSYSRLHPDDPEDLPLDPKVQIHSYNITWSRHGTATTVGEPLVLFDLVPFKKKRTAKAAPAAAIADLSDDPLQEALALIDSRVTKLESDESPDDATDVARAEQMFSKWMPEGSYEPSKSLVHNLEKLAHVLIQSFSDCDGDVAIDKMAEHDRNETDETYVDAMEMAKAEEASSSVAVQSTDIDSAAASVVEHLAHVFLKHVF